VHSKVASNTTDLTDIVLDELYEDAKEIVIITEKKTSISYIQRRLRIRL
jgi:S-DNA-T family DNA segregation ATPase FtsK/SpoIIIE